MKTARLRDKSQDPDCDRRENHVLELRPGTPTLDKQKSAFVTVIHHATRPRSSALHWLVPSRFYYAPCAPQSKITQLLRAGPHYFSVRISPRSQCYTPETGSKKPREAAAARETGSKIHGRAAPREPRGDLARAAAQLAKLPETASA